MRHRLTCEGCGAHLDVPGLKEAWAAMLGHRERCPERPLFNSKTLGPGLTDYEEMHP